MVEAYKVGLAVAAPAAEARNLAAVKLALRQVSRGGIAAGLAGAFAGTRMAGARPGHADTAPPAASTPAPQKGIAMQRGSEARLAAAGIFTPPGAVIAGPPGRPGVFVTLPAVQPTSQSLHNLLESPREGGLASGRPAGPARPATRRTLAQPVARGASGVSSAPDLERQTGRVSGAGAALSAVGGGRFRLAAPPAADFTAERIKSVSYWHSVGSSRGFSDDATASEVAELSPARRNAAAWQDESLDIKAQRFAPPANIGRKRTASSAAGRGGRAASGVGDFETPGPHGKEAEFDAAENAHPASQTGPTEGDVFLDGALVGKWISRALAREAARPPAGGAGFDSRRNAPPSGRMIGG